LNQRRAWLRGLPKAELHVHLEGTITPQTYGRIAKRRNLQLPSDVGAAFACSDFGSFLRAFVAVVKDLREPEDFAEIAAEYLHASTEAGVLHVEFFFSPATIRHFHKDADVRGIVQAIGEVAQAAKRNNGISSAIIFDLVRNLGEDTGLADIDLAQQCLSEGVVGIGLGGDERNFPARDFHRVFDRAKRLGLRRTVHAGEAAGPDSVRDAIEVLNAERIGHGVAAIQDDALLQTIGAREIGIDSCLTSNRITGAIAAAEDHPLQTFLSRGLNVTLSSDDPSFFGASLLDEYEKAMDAGLTRDDVITLARNSFRMAFADDQAKRGWLDKLDAYAKEEGRT
jgi:adenosine deaminase